jgi:hypothetical protein
MRTLAAHVSLRACKTDTRHRAADMMLWFRLPLLCAQFGVSAEQLTSDKGTHVLASAVVLAAPAGIAWLWHLAGMAVARHRVGGTASSGEAAGAAAAGSGVPFLWLSYSLLPLVWAGMCARPGCLALSGCQ